MVEAAVEQHGLAWALRASAEEIVGITPSSAAASSA
jgi:hypothetical protein